MPTLKKKGIPIGAAPPKRPKEFSKRGPELGSRLHPLHSVVTVISNKMGAPYPNLVEHPMFEAILRCLEESRHTFEAKKQWLSVE